MYIAVSTSKLACSNCYNSLLPRGPIWKRCQQSISKGHQQNCTTVSF